MTILSRYAALPVTAGLLLALTAAPAGAQSEGDVTLDPRAGVIFPVGGLADVTTFGASGGLGVAYHVTSHLALRGDVELSVLDDRKDEFGVVISPPMSLMAFTAGLEVDFPPRRWQDEPLTFRWNVGVGGMRMDAEEHFADGSSLVFQHTFTTLQTGGKIGYRLSPTLTAFVGSQVYAIFTGEDDTRLFSERSIGAEPFAVAWTVPLSVGVQATIR